MRTWRKTIFHWLIVAALIAAFYWYFMAGEVLPWSVKMKMTGGPYYAGTDTITYTSYARVPYADEEVYLQHWDGRHWETVNFPDFGWAYPGIRFEGTPGEKEHTLSWAASKTSLMPGRYRVRQRFNGLLFSVEFEILPRPVP